MFSSDVIEEIKCYVYRLIDPRNGETFYVGKGKGNRVFAHAAGNLDTDDIEVSDKLQRIREIKLSGFEVAHVIHRHGMDDKTATEVEAALLDAYPGLTNIASGHNASEWGTMHADEIIEKYQAPEAEFLHDVVIINVNRTALQRSLYDAVRYAWKIDPSKARKANFILAVQRGLIVGVYQAKEWLPATHENFPDLPEARDDRWGFIGEEAPKTVKKKYLRKRLPEGFRKRGASNPIRYASKFQG